MVFIPVILAGGKGERFWPLSRIARPKQFLCLDGSGRTLMQATADRLLPIAGGWDKLWVITASHLEAGCREQLPELPAENLLVEPEGRDTAAAVAWTTIEIAKRYGDEAVIGFFPADHWVDHPDRFTATLKAAAKLASDRPAIVTLGIQPNYPSTGYGYIEQGESIGSISVAAQEPGGVSLEAFTVSRFTEKPDRETAEAFLASGRFSWNGGIFVFRAGVALAELKTYVPQLIAQLETHGVAIYPSLEKISIDYALMEKTELAYVLPVTFGWDDLGDWNAIERLMKLQAKTTDGTDLDNVELASHISHDTHGAIVYANDAEEVIVTIGLEDVVVVRDGKATLIVHKDRTQEIKQVLTRLKADPKFDALL
ncbi:MAG: mannose-1-phosphate guanylyltransferase [Oscillatoriales cyanobacterium]|nr:MAG: mannose-1-phosphate guanylyltransferase [Oscillatoriales cyanobacterium]